MNDLTTGEMQRSMNLSPTSCGVCHEEYDEEERCPRIFSCSHTLCHDCIEKLIKKKIKLCPFCRRDFQADQAKEITVNHNTLEFMRYLSHHEIKLKSSSFSGHAPPRQTKIDEMKKDTLETNSRHATDCQEVKKQIETATTKVICLHVYLTEQNDMIEKEILPKLHSIIIQNKKKLEELKKTSSKLDDKMKEIINKSSQLEDIKVKLEICAANTFKEISSLLDEAEEANVPIAECIRHFKINICEEGNALTRTLKEFEDTKETLHVILESLKSREGLIQEKRPLLITKLLSLQKERLPQQISTAMLKEMPTPLRELVDRGNLFVIQELEGRKRRARLSLTADSRLVLHHLKDEPLPPNAHFVELSDILKLGETAPTLTFLELSNTSGSSIGRVYIRLIPGLKRAKQFSVLCTGEMGPTYVNTKILGLVNKGSFLERLQFGDYERNDGIGGKASIIGVGQESGGDYIQPWLAGTVTGRWPVVARAAQFFIYTGSRPTKELDASFGIVENGLRVLSEAIFCNPNIQDVVISDCGLILPVG